MRRSLAICALLIACAGAVHAQPVRRDYYEGDWVSFVDQRHITGLAQGFETVYIATPNGVGRYSSIGLRFLPPLTASSGLDDPEILRIAFDEGRGELWVETPMGIASYNETFGEWRRGGTFPAELVRDDAPRERFTTLFTPWEIIYQPPDRSSPNGVFVDHQLRRYPVTCALVDASNSSRVFLGTWGGGLVDVDKNSQQATFRPYGLYQEAVETIYADEDHFYFGGRDPRNAPPVVSVMDRRDTTWSYLDPNYDVPVAGDITAITSLGDWMFFGTPEGLLRYDLKKKRWRKYDRRDGLPEQEVTSLAVDGKLIWVGTSHGPGLLDPAMDTAQPAISLATPRIGSDWVYDFVRAYGYVWAATQTGLYRIRQSEGDWSRISTSAGLLLGPVRGIAARPEGLWCATSGGLILIDSLLEAKEVFRSGVELADGNLYAVAVDADNLWVSSKSGVWRYLREKGFWRQYTRNDGLLADFAYDLEIDGDYIWIGTDGGVSRFLWKNPLRID